jgi:hypothetical protein
MKRGRHRFSVAKTARQTRRPLGSLETAAWRPDSLPELRHDALVDSIVDYPKVCHIYPKGGWTLLRPPE